MTWNWEQKNWPNWEFNSKNLEKYEQAFLINAAKTAGAWKYMSQQEKTNIHIDLLSDEAIKSSQIEWEMLNRDSVRSSIGQHFWFKTWHRAPPSEAGIAQMMIDIFQNYEKPITNKDLFKWHAYICNGRTDLNDVWKYRTHSEPMQIVSWQIDKPKVHFEAVPSKQVEKEMNIFLTWLNEKDIPALSSSALAHLYFVSIHPFEDGNGRLSRAISEKILSDNLWYPSLIALSQIIEKRKNEYYNFLEKNNRILQVDSWLEWFCSIVLEAQEYSLSVIDFIIKKTKIFDSLWDDINERQKRVMLRLFDAGLEGFSWWLSAKNYMTIAKTTVSTATRDLSDLVKKWALKRTGERKSTRYYLNI